ncbi:MAG: transglycosylase SLT domain-containing protein [Gemmatimonadaceae bacterium]|nr:transglycosylase SLT domain-containing protein [Gemmatimonadaceae bacterium]
MPDGGNAGERRHRADRREGSAQDSADRGRRGVPRSSSTLVHLLRAVGAAVVLLGVIIYTVRVTRPVYATRGSLGEELRKRAPEVAAVIAPVDSSAITRFMTTPQFESEKRNFYEDVMRLKQVDSARADSIAHYAVREAYRRGISPAIIFGVMLTENSRFVSKATSNVGAVGLMQVYPKVWLNKEMTKLFGRDLATDSTNVKYGVFILNQYFRPKDRKGQVRERDWATALLRYNGCVRGTNTPRCHTYPSKVKGFIENQGSTICRGRGFYDCIAKPFMEGLLGEAVPDSTAATTGVVTTPTSQPAAAVPTPSAPVTIALPPPSTVTTTARPATPVRAKAKARATTKAPMRRPARRARRAPARSGTQDAIPPPPKPIIIRIP